MRFISCLVVPALLTACLSPSNTAPAPHAATYLFAWAGDEDRKDNDFLAVIDLAPHGDRYGTVVATLPVGESSLWPHHTESSLGPSGMLFANGYAGNRSMLFDLRDPLHPAVVSRLTGAGTGSDLSFLHSFDRLPNGHVIVTFQGHGPDNAPPGGIAELDERGRLLRSRSAADPAGDLETLRPYGLAVVPALNRIVVALTFMPLPAWSAAHGSIEHAHAGNQVQVYRLSDLSLIKTITLPTEANGPNEPRLLRDGKTVLVGTVSCNLYRVTGLAGATPGVELVHHESPVGCATPLVVGDWWVQTNAPGNRILVYDLHDLAHVRTVSTLTFDARQRTHWLASDGASRIVMLNEPNNLSERRIWMLKLNRATGALSVDSAFRDEGSLQPGLSFDRTSWPHGNSGTAVPHGTVFSFH
jgi:hypothetical protein